MGTHPIFESDFDCLTDMTFLLFLSILVVNALKSSHKSAPECKVTYTSSFHPKTMVRLEAAIQAKCPDSFGCTLPTFGISDLGVSSMNENEEKDDMKECV